MTAWSAFRQEVFGEPYLVWHDGPDFSDIARRFAADPAAVLAMLRLGIGDDDPVAAEACRHLDATADQVPAVVALLRETMPATSGGTRTEVAASMHALGGDPVELGAEITRVLASGEFWGVRLDAARRLAGFAPTRALVEAAAGGVCDAEYLVRFHSASMLLHWAGRSGDISKDDELFGLLVDDGGPDGWAEVARRLSAAALNRL